MKLGDCRSGQMPAGGEAHDADFVRIDPPFFRVLADQLNRALGVLQRPDRRIDHRLRTGQPVFEDDRGDAVLVVILGRKGAFHAEAQTAVAAAGTYNYSRASRSALAGEVNGVGGPGNGGDALAKRGVLVCLGVGGRPAVGNCTWV